ncbi:uncharacterized protein LOC103008269 isoform X10 [Balaenoptera acutorostrata]|uniref:Uncharacterized protein LOC103008269 isoform X10 n=1 Tax=Balaenoptera acutorostrata TaxID=9767 RepID=A0ABM3TJJ5_BALAC|nr:uncharacterized protein LOC103008269 isoform X10 [Balaenoptera acutorostrata]
MVMSQVSDIFRSTLLDRQIHETWRAEKFVLRVKHQISEATVTGCLEKKEPEPECSLGMDDRLTNILMPRRCVLQTRDLVKVTRLELKAQLCFWICHFISVFRLP